MSGFQGIGRVTARPAYQRVLFARLPLQDARSMAEACDEEAGLCTCVELGA